MNRNAGLMNSDTDWPRRLNGKAAQARLPISATLELTRRCNLRCRHCYLGDQAEQHKQRALERDTEAVKTSLREWAEAGVLYLLITGGDPMMRRDFSEIYRQAREYGMVVTVFCDGILVTDRIVELFKELPPRRVGISIYGATAKTYEHITRIPGSYARAWNGIRRLLDAGIRVELKTILMTLNEQEREAMAAQAADWGVVFRHDTAIFPCLPDGSTQPLDLRVTPEQAVAHDMADPKRRAQWRNVIETLEKTSAGDRLYTCGAGASHFYCDPYGNLSPCLITTRYRYAQGDRPFHELWRDELSEIRKKRRTRSDTLLAGPLRGACAHCPAMNYLENGDEEQESDFMRKTTLLRHQTARRIPAKGAPYAEKERT